MGFGVAWGLALAAEAVVPPGLAEELWASPAAGAQRQRLVLKTMQAQVRARAELLGPLLGTVRACRLLAGAASS